MQLDRIHGRDISRTFPTYHTMKSGMSRENVKNRPLDPDINNIVEFDIPIEYRTALNVAFKNGLILMD